MTQAIGLGLVTFALSFRVLDMILPRGRRVGGLTWVRVGRYSFAACKRRA
jgi:hypothetical protein